MWIIILLLLFLPVSFTYAQVFNVDAVHLSPNIDLTIKTLETDGDPLDAVLVRYDNPADPDGLYWRLGSIAPGLQIRLTSCRLE